MNCWEALKCAETTYKKCPAYPKKGLDCWKVTGTMCNQGKQSKASAAEKIEYCRSCSFYKDYAHKF
jgi:hypothetical protein